MARTTYKSVLRTTIGSVHGVNARWLTVTHVQESVNGRVVWEGEVDTFELTKHPEAKYCYAWSMETADGTAVLTALKIPPVTSAQTAIHEAIAQGKMDPKRVILRK